MILQVVYRYVMHGMRAIAGVKYMGILILGRWASPTSSPLHTPLPVYIQEDEVNVRVPSHSPPL